ncbi:cobalamin biosynthesis protein [Devosia sp. FKR38]|uniref:cobalamin biosynthesis protein n=1 Tax=Devosia sp. FKR38 TaxID=2562312 RepID=UPI0014850BDF|nr:cobalamin biosynthesis protein [Devosia sp. FKR38]
MTAFFAAMPHHTDRIVAGIGFASAVRSDELVALVTACLVEAGIAPEQLIAIATHVRKQGASQLAALATHFDVPLRLLTDDDLSGNVPGVAEAVAAEAGAVLLPKRKSALATCALAICAPDFVVSGFGQPASLSRVTAASTLSTSIAGP